MGNGKTYVLSEKSANSIIIKEKPMRPVSRTEIADLDDLAEIKSLCRKHLVSRAKFYEITGLNEELTIQSFYAALRGDACTPGVERALTISLITFKDKMSIEKRNTLKELLQNLRRRHSELDQIITKLTAQLGG